VDPRHRDDHRGQPSVSEADFITAQDVNAARGPASQAVLAVPQKRQYLLPALYLILSGTERAGGRRRRTRRGADIRQPVSGQEVTSYLRDRGITLTYDPAAGTLQAGTSKPPRPLSGKQANPARRARTGRRRRKPPVARHSASLRLGDVPACRKTADYGVLLCPRLEHESTRNSNLHL
jgi:hypothetical protein